MVRRYGRASSSRSLSTTQCLAAGRVLRIFLDRASSQSWHCSRASRFRKKREGEAAVGVFYAKHWLRHSELPSRGIFTAKAVKKSTRSSREPFFEGLHMLGLDKEITSFYNPRHKVSRSRHTFVFWAALIKRSAS